MHAVATSAVPADYRDDIRRAFRILTEGGCSEVFLFGSVPRGDAGRRSDLDIAVRGCPASRFFDLLGRLLMELDHPVDLVDLDEHSDFGERLVAEERLFRVADDVPGRRWIRAGPGRPAARHEMGQADDGSTDE